MKKYMSLFLFAFFTVTLSLSKTNAFADEIYTPAGISYNDIGNALDQYIEKY